MNEEYPVILGNSGAIDDEGWALIAPFGEWPKTRVVRKGSRAVEERFIQVLDNAAAEALVKKENGIFRRIKRAIVGIPVYAGHPDLADHAPETLAGRGGSSASREKKQIGIVDKVRRGRRGSGARFGLSPEGAEAV